MLKLTLSNLPAAVVLLGLSTHLVSAQSDVRGQLFDTTTAANSAALAIGSGASAGIGGIVFAKSKFNGTAVSTTTAANSAALAIGDNASARLRSEERREGK